MGFLELENWLTALKFPCIFLISQMNSVTTAMICFHSNALNPFHSMNVVTAMICHIISCYCTATAVMQRVHSNTDDEI